MKRIIYIFGLILLTNLASGQVYQSMPQYGYGPIKRMDLDSSLTIPTTCGVPTLRTYITKKAAIAYDSCNKRFYFYDPKLLAWDTIKGGGGGSVIDTTSLSNRIDARVKYTDTASMLSPYLRKIDTTRKFINRIEQINGWDSIRYFIGDTAYKVRTGMDTSRVLIAKVSNAEATTLTRGTVVYLYGASGDVASVKRANNKGDAGSARTIGVVRADIAAGQIGYVTTKGQVDKLDLGAYNEGDVLYLDSIDGQFTKTKPQAPYHQVFLGIVERANAGNGLAYISPINGFEIDELHNVKITSPLNNQVLVYSDTQQLWKNRSVYSVVDTTQLSTRIDQRVKYSDTANMLSPYLDGQDTVSLSSRINAKQNQLNGTGFVVASGTNITYDNTSYLPSTSYEWVWTQGLQALGSTIKGVNLGTPVFYSLGGAAVLTSTAVRFVPYYLPQAATLTGVKFYQPVAGNYTGNNYNGVGLYSYSAGTLTLVASTTNSSTFWVNSSNTWQTKPFSSTYSASAGVYYLGLMYSFSSQTTAPQLLAGSTVNNAFATIDLTNSAKIAGVSATGQTALPTSIAMSSINSTTNVPLIYLY